MNVVSLSMQVQNISLFLNIPLLVVGFFLLNRGSGMLVDGASSIARKLKMPETMIGFTIVAFGTSLPKIFTIILAAYNGFNDLVFGAIIGSCIFNFLGILSITGFFRPIRANKYTAGIGFSLLLFAIIILFYLANFSLFSPPSTTFEISRKDGFFLIACFMMFMTYGYFNLKRNHKIWFNEEVKNIISYAVWFSVVLMLVGILSLIAGGVLVIDNLIDVSRKFDMTQRFLGQFILSVGGSAVMLYWIMITKTNETKFELSNLLGQNMLNILGVLGAAAIIQPITFSAVFNIDIFILFGITLLLMALLWQGNKRTLNLWKCRFLFVLLLLYILYLFIR
ncbi:MAG: sodium:calcium antiporter [Chitinophagales bacterium]|nr:sodium:calcium antiporter [Chitinophagales bacterium]